MPARSARRRARGVPTGRTLRWGRVDGVVAEPPTHRLGRAGVTDATCSSHGRFAQGAWIDRVSLIPGRRNRAGTTLNRFRLIRPLRWCQLPTRARSSWATPLWRKRPAPDSASPVLSTPRNGGSTSARTGFCGDTSRRARFPKAPPPVEAAGQDGNCASEWKWGVEKPRLRRSSFKSVRGGKLPTVAFEDSAQSVEFAAGLDRIQLPFIDPGTTCPAIVRIEGGNRAVKEARQLQKTGPLMRGHFFGLPP